MILAAEHAVLREKWTDEIVAYTRLKLFQGHEIGQSYSAQNLKSSSFIPFTKRFGNWSYLCPSTVSIWQGIIHVVAESCPQSALVDACQIPHGLCQYSSGG